MNLFGGEITDVTISVGATGSKATVVEYTVIAMGSLARLTKEIWDDNISQDEDGDQIYGILSSVLLGTWNDVPAASTWATYSATETWADALNLGLGEIDQPGLYEMENRAASPDTIYNIASLIANSAFGYLYEDNEGNIGYADADHRQNYLLVNGYVELSANHALGSGLSTIMRSGDIRNDIYINYGNNFGSQETASSASSIATYGYKAETINSVLHDATDAQAVADRYIAQRAFPQPAFQAITFPITNPEIDNADRDSLLSVFMGMPVNLQNLPTQISGGEFEGYVEGWSWSTRFNELFLTINLSPVAFSQVAMRWNTTPATEAWNTLSTTLTWEYATIVSSGTLDNVIDIEPYTEGNVHFINNSQVKIVRKGYQVVESNTQYTYVENMANNGNFKYVVSGEAVGWRKEVEGTGIVTLVTNDDNEFNYYTIKKGASGFNFASITNVVPPYFKEHYAPMMYGPGATLSFEYQAASVGDKIWVRIELYMPTSTGYVSYYLRSDSKWTTTSTNIQITAENEQIFEAKTIDIPLGKVADTTPFLGIYDGHIIVTFIATTAIVGGDIKNVKLVQLPNQLTALEVKRQIGVNNLIVKSIDLPYGLYHPPFTSWNGGNNNFGAFFNLYLTGFFNGSLINWYRYDKPTEQFYDLHSLLIRQYSNLFNRNIATLEGDLGNYNSINGLVYLDKTYTVQDASTNALSYNDKKFLINRLTMNTYDSEVNSIQLIEVIDEDNDSVETIKYIGL